MIKNIFYIITGIYISQEYKYVIPNIKNHIKHTHKFILSNENEQYQLLLTCPILKFIFKK